MSYSLRTVLRALTPPVFGIARERLRSWKRGRSGKPSTRWSPEQLRLKAEHDRRNAGCPRDEIVMRDGIRLRLHPESRYPFEVFCYASPEMVAEMDSFIAATANKQRLLDVGALHGVFSLVFAANDPRKEALAVDPSPIAFAKLLYNVHKNAAMNITPVDCALSDESGVLNMHYDWEHVVAGGAEDGESLLRVECRTGDSLCDAYAFSPDVIKIDVEGHEVKVLEGLRKTINQNKPLIFLEVHPVVIQQFDGNGSLSEMVTFLAELGYQSAEVRGNVVPVAELTRIETIERVLLRPDVLGALSAPRSSTRGAGEPSHGAAR